MKKYNVMDHEMVMVDDLKFWLRKLRDDAETDFKDFKGSPADAAVETCNKLIRQIFIDEIRAAKTQDEIDAIIEMTGDFIVYKRGQSRSDITYFAEYAEGKPRLTSKAVESMTFAYKSMADKVAAELGDGWEVMDICDESIAYGRRMLKAIFGEDKEDET